MKNNDSIKKSIHTIFFHNCLCWKKVFALEIIRGNIMHRISLVIISLFLLVACASQDILAHQMLHHQSIRKVQIQM